MNRVIPFVVSLVALIANCSSALEPIQRRIPPIGIEIPQNVVNELTRRSNQLRRSVGNLTRNAADVEVFLKAVEAAISNREIYTPKQLPLLDKTLDLAQERLARIQSEDERWKYGSLVVRGFRSNIDDSAQPYGLVFGSDVVSDRPSPLYVWLHGRGDKTTDLHFIHQRLSKGGQVQPNNAIVLHPFGRQCLGYKSAGETDVFEAIAHVEANYKIDPERIVLMGFSMGGAGVWHLGAHFTDQFIAMSPGAGFAETSRYQKLSTAQIASTPWYERQLWKLYDVPNYVRNLFNVPVVCYSGENDKQIQAARVMEAAYAAHGRTLDHVIGPGMGHKYDAGSLAEVSSKMDVEVNRNRPAPKRLFFQTQTLRYSRMRWLHVERLDQHWQDTTVDAVIDEGVLRMKTKNVAQLKIAPIPQGVQKLEVDGVSIPVSGSQITISRSTTWQTGALSEQAPLAKVSGLQGPIDDAFLSRFVVVPPSKKSTATLRNEWVHFELNHLRNRWWSLFRGKLPEKRADEINEDDVQSSHLVLFGDSESNPLLGKILKQLPLTWDLDNVKIGSTAANGSEFVPCMIYPNPLNPKKYVVINSGPTFREAHDRTNSLQNPKLPDWAIIDITTPPNDEKPGRIVDAGFFDENWNYQRNLTQ